MVNLKINIDGIYAFAGQDKIQALQHEVDFNYKTLLDKNGRGNEFLGWLTLADETLKSGIIQEINATAFEIRKNSEVVVVIGIGGSYLGARAVIESLKPHFQQYQKGNPEIIYAGQNISEDYLHDLLQLLDKKDYSIIVISKSGTTTEPALAFRLLKKHIEKKYDKENARKRIVAITDKEKGALKKLADAEKYTSFIIPDDVGGRFSVLTPVGLLPAAVAGIDIKELLQGASAMKEELFKTSTISDNPACSYVAARNILYRS